MRPAVFVALAWGQIQILNPPTLIDDFPGSKGSVIGSTATFGIPFYGEMITGRLVYGMPGSKQHCTAEDYDIDDTHFAPADSEEYPEQLAKIVVVRRGGPCTFTHKVQVAQDTKGAHAVIVVDKEQSKYTSNNIRSVIMSDDGTGSQIHIPSLLVANSDGEKLISAIGRADKQRTRGYSDADVIVQLEWDVPRERNVLVDFWMSSGSVQAKNFLEGFFPYARKLGKNRLSFIPHYNIVSMTETGTNLCFEHGRKYCAADPDFTGPITGKDVVEEDLRQLCLWRETAEYSDDSDKSFETFSSHWWKYVTQFHEKCITTEMNVKKKFGEECSYSLIDNLDGHLPHLSSDVKRCVRDDHTGILEEQLNNRGGKDLVLRINGWKFEGALDPDSAVRAVCTGFHPPAPQACKDIIRDLGTHQERIFQTQGISTGSLIGLIIALLVAMVAVLHFFRRLMSKGIRSALRSEVMLEVGRAVSTRNSGPEAYAAL